MRDRMASYEWLLQWLQAGGLLPAGEAARLWRQAVAAEGCEASGLAKARAFRADCRRLVRAFARGEPAAPDAVARFNAWLGRTRARPELVTAAGQATIAWRFDATPDEAALGPLIVRAAEFLARCGHARVRECEGVSCGWLYLDTSRNRSRRWCDMRVCGNREKARRHRARTRDGGETTGDGGQPRP